LKNSQNFRKIGFFDAFFTKKKLKFQIKVILLVLMFENQRKNLIAKTSNRFFLFVKIIKKPERVY